MYYEIYLTKMQKLTIYNIRLYVNAYRYKFFTFQ